MRVAAVAAEGMIGDGDSHDAQTNRALLQSTSGFPSQLPRERRSKKRETGIAEGFRGPVPVCASPQIQKTNSRDHHPLHVDIVRAQPPP